MGASAHTQNPHTKILCCEIVKIATKFDRLSFVIFTNIFDRLSFVIFKNILFYLSSCSTLSRSDESALVRSSLSAIKRPALASGSATSATTSGKTLWCTINCDAKKVVADLTRPRCTFATWSAEIAKAAARVTSSSSSSFPSLSLTARAKTKGLSQT